MPRDTVSAKVVRVPSLSARYFDQMYAADPDPWQIGAGWYETRKRDLVLSLLPEPRYKLALEPGCGNGDLTERLRARCESVIAWDAATAAVEATRARFAEDPQVQVSAGHLPDAWPNTPEADLMVLSELGYYLDLPDLDRFLDEAVDRLQPGATFLAVHWRWPVEEYPLTGDAVHDRIAARPELSRLGGYADMDVRIDIFILDSAQPRSVAQRAGVIA
ncbi:MAG: Methyltransferase type 12 [Pseudonocardiales bacterium]|nr:Methyltransferase type 12 [Pseudonocardiales bacterium]